MVSQPTAVRTGKTTAPRVQLGVTEQNNVMHELEETMTVGELARALNALGAAPRDLITIFQTLKAGEAAC